ncbi:MAG TPA: ECF-type sigma factor [Gemmataceae bacterium]|nr:ECF-type sigma factor [Gemmataceae bacterium]
MSDVTRLLDAAAAGEPHAAADLLPLVYAELRGLAAARMAGERPDHTLNPTALVHEAYLRLVGGDTPRNWDGRGHFFAAAAEAMRRILVEAARRRSRLKHGGGLRRVDWLDEEVAAAPQDDEQLLLLDEALTRLAAARPQAARLVQLRFFSGLTAEEAAPVVGLAPRSARRLWAYARAWLRRDMGRAADPPP